MVYADPEVQKLFYTSSMPLGKVVEKVCAAYGDDASMIIEEYQLEAVKEKKLKKFLKRHVAPVFDRGIKFNWISHSTY